MDDTEKALRGQLMEREMFLWNDTTAVKTALADYLRHNGRTVESLRYAVSLEPSKYREVIYQFWVKRPSGTADLLSPVGRHVRYHSLDAALKQTKSWIRYLSVDGADYRPYVVLPKSRFETGQNWEKDYKIVWDPDEQIIFPLHDIELRADVVIRHEGYAAQDLAAAFPDFDWSTYPRKAVATR